MNLLKKKLERNSDIYNKVDAIHKSQTLPVLIRPFEYSDVPSVCSWVPTSDELTKISGDTGHCLTEDILQRWCDDSIIPIVLQSVSEPVVFCTLSIQEYDLPKGTVEVCHFVTAPTQRRKYFATVLLNYLRLIAAQYNYKKMVGRIVRSNTVALKLTEYIRWAEINNLSNIYDPEFRWFNYELRK